MVELFYPARSFPRLEVAHTNYRFINRRRYAAFLYPRPSFISLLKMKNCHSRSYRLLALFSNCRNHNFKLLVLPTTKNVCFSLRYIQRCDYISCTLDDILEISSDLIFLITDFDI